MSLESWKEEFYPVEANVYFGKENNLQGAIEATEHALRKWKGLTKENLDEHGLDFIYSWRIAEINDIKYNFSITGVTCACCQISRDEYGNIDCERCPIYFIHGHDCNDIYGDWQDDHNPSAMIKLLEDTLDWLKNTDEETYGTR